MYEVTLRVRRGIAAAYREWLAAHVDEILGLPGVVAAETFSVRDADDDGSITLCVHYRMRDDAALDAYLREHAPRLRAEGIARFDDGFSAQRRVLRPLID